MANFVITEVNAIDSTNSGLDKTAFKAGLTTSESPTDVSLAGTIGQIIGIILSFLGIIFFVLVIYGGFLWMTAAGSEEQVGKAKKIIVYAAIGIIIILSAYVITNFITTEFTKIVVPST